MTTIIAVLLGFAVGVILLAVVFWLAFRRKPARERPDNHVENYDVFDKDPGFYGSSDHHST